MLRITETVKHLIIINVLMYFGTIMLESSLGWNRNNLAFFPPSTGLFQPFQIVSHMFMHGDLGHLFFNMFALFSLGPMLESYLNPKRFLFYYISCGIGALLFSLLMSYIMLYSFGAELKGGLGASGAIFGILLAAFIYFPERELSLIIPPITLKLKVLVPILMMIEWYLGTGGFNTGIGHFAHLGGAFTGFIIIMFWRKFNNRW